MTLSKNHLKLIILLFFTILSLSYAYAENSTDINAKNFNDLNEKVNSEYAVELDDNYIQHYSQNNLTITKSVHIDGKGHTINFNDSDTLKVNSSEELNIVIRNTTLKNLTKIKFENNLTHNITFIDCKFDEFKNYKLSADAPFTNNYSYNHTTGEIKNIVKKIAKLIVGRSTDLAAAKKLAKWVGKNIKYERNKGFIQSPYETLLYERGNCCSQTDLFLQMCAALGINKKHKLYYVHSGSLKLGDRHFFAMIDNICIDVSKYRKNPWGHCLMVKNKIYSITKYPYLPLPREY